MQRLVEAFPRMGSQSDVMGKGSRQEREEDCSLHERREVHDEQLGNAGMMKREMIESVVRF
jgi:hypothetical protein